MRRVLVTPEQGRVRRRAYWLLHRQEMSAKNKQWRKTHPQEMAVITRRNKLRDRYGITPDQYEAMVAAQNARCATCPTKDGESGGQSRRLAIDHDHSVAHKTKAIRGVLCHRCNSILGLAHDDIEILKALILYLEVWKAKTR